MSRSEASVKRTCPMCGGKIVEAKVRVAISGSPVGQFDGYRCERCGEEFLAERSLEPAHEEVVRSGLFGIERQTSLFFPTNHGFWSTSSTISAPTLSATPSLFEKPITYNVTSHSTPSTHSIFTSSVGDSREIEVHSSLASIVTYSAEMVSSRNGTVDTRLYQTQTR